ncbi:hypothetical protein KL86PLE_100628 [uncultured Pleomorphomonas sp.]|uniref:Uncharacterized protein n=1 Tax=uncultured Pleomorphomonas sp. TaxID=442121 RepID=A0A212L4W8_9HYPH|nr:hypothetical protein KL86PLE_100628 [uncultured Pleomorphomonas sp.]
MGGAGIGRRLQPVEAIAALPEEQAQHLGLEVGIAEGLRGEVPEIEGRTAGLLVVAHRCRPFRIVPKAFRARRTGAGRGSIGLRPPRGAAGILKIWLIRPLQSKPVIVVKQGQPASDRRRRAPSRRRPGRHPPAGRSVTICFKPIFNSMS